MLLSLNDRTQRRFSGAAICFLALIALLPLGCSKSSDAAPPEGQKFTPGTPPPGFVEEQMKKRASAPPPGPSGSAPKSPAPGATGQ